MDNRTVSSTAEQASHKRLVEGSNPSRSTMTSSPSGKADDCKSSIEGSTPSEVSIRDQMISILTLKIDTLNALLVTRKGLSVERVSEFYRLRKRATNLLNWITGGGDISATEVRKWLRR